ncbi:acetyl/propionyl/methylcrotonyl-CoA carboxylase subunit alpha [Specibacter sp. NPDC057265]|uniref:acetyl/propionyl/methylcrotonyl-CoA carboxylase subunit alpha n=1 Tax=Specibacter sp. NPDC057265 TaxID=3346075 RepID=UPI0036454F11
MSALFHTVLVANRGEIACRIIRTLKAQGIRAVAVYSTADADARHVREADLALCIGPAEAAASYLNSAAIIAACRDSGAQAVHPGYGFLSENVQFAQELAAAGITFIGPPVAALNVMGDKIRAKNHVAAAGVPVVPGVAEPGLDDAALLAAAATIGFPLLIKPSAGGGGKGMQAVHAAQELPAALASARRVAAASFGDDTLFLERLVTNPRHIEVQILADQQGHVVHLGERECSLQRRHQKVIEEAPSPLLESLANGAATRERIGAAACAAAASVHYTGAGTVEFLVSNDHPEEFFFMEMNTRLQVEHPVTEMVARVQGGPVDLVQWQLRIAAGEALSFGQQQVGLQGHALEARVYAEDPAAGFLPAGGAVVALDESVALREGVRVDSSLVPELVVTAHYDPLLAKVVAHGVDRAQALERLDDALRDYVVLGVPTNIEYLRLLLAVPEVQAGRLDTNLIERELPAMSFRALDAGDYAAAALAARATALPAAGAALPPWQRRDGWRLGGAAPWRMVFAAPGRTGVVTVGPGPDDGAGPDDGVVQVTGCGQRAPTAARLAPNGNGTAFTLLWGQEVRQYHLAWRDGAQGRTCFLGSGGWSAAVQALDRQAATARMLAGLDTVDAAVDPQVRTPMPGTVTAVHVATGDTVRKGQTLLAVEAMKMEHQLTAPANGTVHMGVAVGNQVKAQQTVATVTPQQEEERNAQL